VAFVTLGCARNEVDSDELAGRLAADGWVLTADPADADAVLVNTCGFIEAAKKDSIDTLLAAAQVRDDSDAESSGAVRPRAVVAVGCLAERYGAELAASLPEADAVLGFDAYPTISGQLASILGGTVPGVHQPRDRRTLLPLSPVARADSRAAQAAQVMSSGGAGAPPPRIRLTAGPVASLKLASGCDRRCAFCAIPSFRGAFVSRPPDDILAEAEQLAADGVRELLLVSENSTSYGKDLGDIQALDKLLPQLAAVGGIVRVRPVYLQPAEVRPGLLEALLTTPGVAPYLDLSFQHASGPLLRRMRRFGDGERFADLLARARALEPLLGARSNVIVGFPGETRADVAALECFLSEARLDAVGVFGYSDEDGTEAVGLDGHIPARTIASRVRRLTDLVEHLTSARAEERVGELVEVLVEEANGALAEGRAAHQAPEVDGSCVVRGVCAVGDLVRARVVASSGVDLVTELVEVVSRADAARPSVGAVVAPPVPAMAS